MGSSVWNGDGDCGLVSGRRDAARGYEIQRISDIKEEAYDADRWALLTWECSVVGLRA